MDWKKLYAMQKELDNYIEINHHLAGKNFFEEKYLALLVEIGELANETRCFKFWSTKPGSEKSIILAEYVDGLHFILSLGLEIGCQYEPVPFQESFHSETEQFTLVYEKCTSFKHTPSGKNYEEMVESYLQLGSVLGFDENEVEEAYFQKHEINYERQNQGY